MRRRHTDTAESYLRLKSVLCELSELGVSERADVARRQLAAEPELLGRVLVMLQQLQQDEEFLEAELPLLVGAATLGESMLHGVKAGKAHLPGARVGHFEIIEKLGEGGMAVVYRARQSEPVEREVALKIISAHATETQKLRFERECSTLARLSHPGIATMFESGVSDGGEPWVAMELVEGLPITEWCDRHRATAQQRIGLFVGACNAITHAHRRGILHRDIKPSNLMVTRVSGEPTVRVIDFGIAAALTAEEQGAENLTGRHLIGTPAYMSPEAAHISDRQSLDTRSDVYALGVVLCELLCGKRPYDADQYSLAQWVAQLASREAPSMRHLFESLDGSGQQRIASCLDSNVATVRRMLRSDLSAVVARALALEPDRRYPTSQDLARDLSRYLQGRAVLAHPPNAAYRARKFLRRHWAGASAILLVLLTLVGGIVARELEVRHTRAALAESDAVSEFLVDLLEHASPLRVEDEEVLLQDIIDRGTVMLEERFSDQPAVQARLLHTLGRVYGERGDYQRGAELMAEAIEVMDASDIQAPVERINLISDLGVSLRRLGHLDASENVLLQGLELAEPLAGEYPLLLADLNNSLGNVYVLREDYAAALVYHERALELREANLPGGDRQITASLNNVATVLINDWQIDRALPYAQRVFEEWSQSMPPDHPWIGVARNNLAIILERQGRDEEALALMHQALQDTEARLGPDHPDVADLWRNISVGLEELGQREESFEAMQKHRDILATALGPDAARTLVAERRVAQLHLAAGRNQEGLDALDSISARLRAMGTDGSGLATVDLARFRALVDMKRMNEARVVFAEIKQSLAPDSPVSSLDFQAARAKARLLVADGDAEGAVRYLEAVELKGRELLSRFSPNYGYLLTALAQANLDLGNANAARQWAEQAMALWQKIDRDMLILDAHVLIGRACLLRGDHDCAQRELALAVEALRPVYGARHFKTLEAEALLAESQN